MYVWSGQKAATSAFRTVFNFLEHIPVACGLIVCCYTLPLACTHIHVLGSICNKYNLNKAKVINFSLSRGHWQYFNVVLWNRKMTGNGWGIKEWVVCIRSTVKVVITDRDSLTKETSTCTCFVFFFLIVVKWETDHRYRLWDFWWTHDTWPHRKVTMVSGYKINWIWSILTPTGFVYSFQ